MRILIVEDDRDLAAALDDALRFEGYATRVAYNGLEAVRMLAEQSIDIVMLDRDLPIMSGDAVTYTPKPPMFAAWARIRRILSSLPDFVRT